MWITPGIVSQDQLVPIRFAELSGNQATRSKTTIPDASVPFPGRQPPGHATACSVPGYRLQGVRELIESRVVE
jgi:hypothetical protein